MKSFEELENELNEHIDYLRKNIMLFCIPIKRFTLQDTEIYEKLYGGYFNNHFTILSTITIRCKLSEDLIEYYKDHINWLTISIDYNLSEMFIIKFINYLNLNYFSWNTKIDYNKFSNKFKLIYGKYFV